MKKQRNCSWFAVGIVVGIGLTICGYLLRNEIYTRRESANQIEALEDGLKVSSYMDWPVREDVVLTMEQDVYPVGVDIVYAKLENFSDDYLLYEDGLDVSIERKIAGQWHQIPTMPKNSLLMGTRLEEGQDDILYGLPEYESYDYPEGQYRIVLRYTYGPTWVSSKKVINYVATAEFEIRGEKNPTAYGNIRSQRLRAKKAMEDDCLVIQDGEYQNLDQMEFKITKAAKKFPGQIRIVDLDQKTVTDVVIEMDWELRKKVYTIVERKGNHVNMEKLEDLDMWDGYKELWNLAFSED